MTGGVSAKGTRLGVVTDARTSARMSRQRSRDTNIEVSLRKALFARGLRYRLHRRPLPSLRREADLVFPGAMVAVFIDGCFWHGCPEHGTWPVRNADFWRTKITGNVARDRATDEALQAAGWRSIRVWEHESVERAARLIESEVLARRRA